MVKNDVRGSSEGLLYNSLVLGDGTANHLGNVKGVKAVNVTASGDVIDNNTGNNRISANGDNVYVTDDYWNYQLMETDDKNIDKGIDETTQACIDNVKKVKIVFITTSNEFASESYEVRAEDYLIKPYDKTRLENVMDRIFSEKKYGKILELKDGRKIIINSIVYTTFSGHYVTIFMSDGEQIQTRSTQKDFEKMMESFGQLIPSFKGVMVNLEQVDGIEEDRFRMKDGEFVPISRRKYGEVKKQYTDFLMKKLMEKEET